MKKRLGMGIDFVLRPSAKQRPQNGKTNFADPRQRGTGFCFAVFTTPYRGCCIKGRQNKSTPFTPSLCKRQNKAQDTRRPAKRKIKEGSVG